MIEQQDALAALIDRLTRTDGVHETAIPRLAVIRASAPTAPMYGLQKPSLCLAAQGRKQVMLGEGIYHYYRNQFLIASVDLPTVGQVIEASPERPYLCLRLILDPALLGELLLEAGLEESRQPPSAEGSGKGSGMALCDVTPELLDATIRLLRLLESPEDCRFLAPLVEREILYRLLRSEPAGRLRQIALADSKMAQVNRAIAWIREHYREPFRIETVAAAARMSGSALHHHFKAVTAMTPLQYQKQLRLQEARRLILSNAMDAAAAAFAVGYESPSQFSREYRRFFGAPPMRDAARLRGAPEPLIEA